MIKEEKKLLGYPIPLTRESIEEALVRNSKGDKELCDTMLAILDVEYAGGIESDRLDKLRKVIEDSVESNN